MELPIPKPLSYTSSTCIFEKLSLKTRERIHRQIPSLRNMNDMVPYELDSASFSTWCVQVEERKWTIRPIMVSIRNHPGIMRPSEKKDKAVIEFVSPNQKTEKTIDGDHDKLLETLVNHFFKNRTILRKLDMSHWPEFWSNKDPQNFKLRIDELTIWDLRGVFTKLRSFIENKLKKVSIRFIHDFAVLEDPLIKSCEELSLEFTEFNAIPLENILLTLKQKCVKIYHSQLPIDKVQELAADWKETERPLGTMLHCGLKEYSRIVDFFDSFVLHLGAIPSKLPSLGTSFYANCVTIPVNDTTEIVMNGAPMDTEQRGYDGDLKMEMMPRGSTVAK